MTIEKIEIFDTTLRDGEQSPGCSMHLKEKIRLAKQLEDLGVDILEAGFPIASEGDYQAVKAVSEAVSRPTVAALCRAVEPDVLKAIDALKKAKKSRIHTFIATSDIHLEYKLKKTRDEVKEMTRNAIRLASENADEVEFSAEDATRSELDFLCEILQIAVDEGATVLNIPDTVGFCLPKEYANLISTIKERVVGERDDIIISVHCHNDLGLAVALVSGHRCGRETGRMHDQRDRRAGRECRPRRNRHGAGDSGGQNAVPDKHRFDQALSDESAFDLRHQLRRPAQQSDCRAQRLRSRGRDSPARRFEQSALL
jgi:hypothetical protein